MNRIVKAAAVLVGGAVLLASAPAGAQPVMDFWSGWYVGVNGGYSWGRARTNLTETETSSGTITQTTLGGTVIDVTVIPGTTTTSSVSDRARMNGWLGGGQAGFNLLSGAWLFGVEMDLQATGQDGGSTLCIVVGCPAGSTAVTTATDLLWFGTLRARAGWVWDNSLLLYLTGGLAVGRISNDFSLGPVGGATTAFVNGNTTRAGFVGGAGIERRLSERWSVKLEYLFLHFGAVETSATATTTSLPLIVTVGDRRFIGIATTTFNAVVRTRVTDQILRAGLNYRF